MITHAWRIIHIRGERVLLCLLCDRYSWNAHDIAHRYCGYCHWWLERVPQEYDATRGMLGEDIVAQINASERRALERLARSLGIDEPLPDEGRQADEPPAADHA